MEPARDNTSGMEGFTLIELSIALVIIGLIVGGIMVGQNLIQAAAYRQVVQQQEQFKSAVGTFRGKYDCLPGDCVNATTFAFATNGNGDGLIGNTTGYLFGGANTADAEQLVFWQHLFQAGLIPYTPVNFGNGYLGYVPATIRNGDSWWAAYAGHGDGWSGYPTGPLGNVLALVGVPGGCGYTTCGGARFSEGLKPEEAYAIDLKIDDGMPNTGAVQAAASGNWIDVSPLSSVDYGLSSPNLCINGLDANTSAPYASASTNYNTRCNLLFKLGF